jgi:Rrf2 family protein
MLFSHSSSYAIRALTYLAMQPPGKLTGTREISECESIPRSFLGKVLIQLRRARLVRSYKGIGGGYELALPPDRINLLMVVRDTGSHELFENCLLEDRECSSPCCCALHESWIAFRDQLMRMLEQRTLAELAQARLSESIKPLEGVNELGGLLEPSVG